jgi:chloramphenicol 3-O-phosphotransferase
MIALFGGAAGSGKSTLARAWCATRKRAAHVELDRIRELICSGLANPQAPSELQEAQYALSAAATCALARAFAAGGYDVAVDDVLEPEAFERCWRPELAGLDWRIVIVQPSLEAVLERSDAREKRVLDEHVRTQHARCSQWPPEYQVDTSDSSVAASLALVAALLD